jgi:two-component system chemotaxis response regulator CheB
MNLEKGRKIRLLIVDDSSFMRMAIRGILNREPDIEIVGVAADGADGVEKALDLKPDIITMDIEMPKMDGITALREIMKRSPTRVIMVSTLTSEGARATFEALDAGAIDYIPKNVTDSSEAQALFRDDLLHKVKSAFGAITSSKRTTGETVRLHRPTRGRLNGERIRYVGIGASTGGPVALQEVISRIPATFPHGIVVAIHMPKAFTGPFAERLNSKCSLSVREAADGDIVKPGEVLIAPGGVHTTLVKHGGGLVVRTEPTTSYPQHIYVPSVDLMLGSMAEASNGAMLGVVLTGMGNDGFKGMQQVKGLGGVSLVQDQSTSTIYGMPRACIEGGVADEVLPLGEIGPEVARLAD